MRLFIADSLLVTAVVLIFVVPLVIVVLSEMLERLERSDNPFASLTRMARDIVVPAAAFFLVVRYLAVRNSASGVTRFAATILWLLLAWAIIRLLRTFFSAGFDQRGIARRLPNLLLRVPAYLVVAALVIHVVENVWGVPVGELATTLGLGSIALAFALQDTLSGLVSGLLLTANRPFVEGDWVLVGGVEGKVTAIDWRYTTIETRDGDLIVVPNGTVAGESIRNYSRPVGRTRTIQPIDVAFTNPPNRVKEMLRHVMHQTPGILNEPAPVVAVTRIDDPVMGYEVRYWIDDYAHKPAIHDDFMTRVWYASQRFDVPFPSPAYDLYHYDGPQTAKDAEITAEMRREMLTRLDAFDRLTAADLDALAEDSSLQRYAATDSMLAFGDRSTGLVVIVEGLAEASMQLGEDSVMVGELHDGDFFGEEGLFGRPESRVGVNAITDVIALVISYSVAGRVATGDTNFRNEMDAVAHRRRLHRQRLLDTTATRGVEDTVNLTTSDENEPDDLEVQEAQQNQEAQERGAPR